MIGLVKVFFKLSYILNRLVLWVFFVPKKCQSGRMWKYASLSMKQIHSAAKHLRLSTGTGLPVERVR